MNNSTTNFPSSNVSGNDIIASLVICLISLFFLALYLPIVYILLKVKKFSKSPCYTLILSASISDSITLFCWIPVAISILIKDLPPIVPSLALGLINLGWRVQGWHQSLIALNRYVAICRHNKYRLWFSISKVRLIIVITWIHAFLTLFVPAFIPPMIYFETTGYYSAIANGNVALFTQIEDETMTTLFTVISIVCYTLILRNYHVSRRKIQTTNSISQAIKDRADQIKKFRLVWQMFAANLVYLLEAITFYVVWWVPFESIWVSFTLSTVLAIINAGFGAAIFLKFNKEIKTELKKAIGCSISCFNI